MFLLNGIVDFRPVFLRHSFYTNLNIFSENNKTETMQIILQLVNLIFHIYIFHITLFLNIHLNMSLFYSNIDFFGDKQHIFSTLFIFLTLGFCTDIKYKDIKLFSTILLTPFSDWVNLIVYLTLVVNNQYFLDLQNV